MRKGIFIVLALSVFSSPVQAHGLANRLNVPVYLTASFSGGYDSNILRLSDREMERAAETPEMIGNAPTFDSHVLKPALSVLYSPVLFTAHETNFRLGISRSIFGQLSDKSYASWWLGFDYHLGPYRWIKLSYRMTPDLLLRYYRDRDSILSNRKISRFSSETAAVSISWPLYRKTWVRIKPQMNRQYFNPAFTEFDMDVRSIELKVSTRLIPGWSLSGWFKSGRGDNTTFEDGLISTRQDRSYELAAGGANIWKYFHHPIQAVGLITSIEHRVYTSEMANDPLHSGREHVEYRAGIRVKGKLLQDLSGELKLNYRHRKTVSEFSWVEESKTWTKFDIWFELNYKFSLDLFY